MAATNHYLKANSSSAGAALWCFSRALPAGLSGTEATTPTARRCHAGRADPEVTWSPRLGSGRNQPRHGGAGGRRSLGRSCLHGPAEPVAITSGSWICAQGSIARVNLSIDPTTGALRSSSTEGEGNFRPSQTGCSSAAVEGPEPSNTRITTAPTPGGSSASRPVRCGWKSAGCNGQRIPSASGTGGPEATASAGQAGASGRS